MPVLVTCFGKVKRICKETKALVSYRDDEKPVFKSSPCLFMTVIFSVDYKDAGEIQVKTQL